ncbi:MAG: hypothetical protein ACYDCK_03825 [Thermoplasmatota archaeon]
MRPNPWLVALSVLAISLTSLVMPLGAGSACNPSSSHGGQWFAIPSGTFIQIHFTLPANTTEGIWTEAGFNGGGNDRETIAAGLAPYGGGDGAVDGVQDPSGQFVYARVGPEVISQGSTVTYNCNEADANLRSFGMQAGSYVLTAAAVAPSGNGFAITVPSGASVTSVARGVAFSLLDNLQACTIGAHYQSQNNGLGANGYAGCATTFTATSHAFRGVVLGEQPDATHQAYWTAPDGSRIQFQGRMDLGEGGPGAWTFDVPIYASLPWTNGNGPNADNGIVGVFADVPA